MRTPTRLHLLQIIYLGTLNSIYFSRGRYEITRPPIASSSQPSGPNDKANIIATAQAQYGNTAKLLTLGEFMHTPHKFVMYNPTDGTPDWIAFTGKTPNALPTECETYKIRLMPKNYSLDFTYDVTDALFRNKSSPRAFFKYRVKQYTSALQRQSN